MYAQNAWPMIFCGYGYTLSTSDELWALHTVGRVLIARFF